jgi:hypothetical protein
MNRLSPLVERYPRRPGTARAWAIGEEALRTPPSGTDVRLFLTAFAAGLVVFGTFFA